MEIELKNGEKLNLEVTPLLLEYIEDYDGGIIQLKKDANDSSKKMYAVNQLLYAIIASNCDEVLTYRQAVRLVKLEDINKILQFTIDSIPDDLEEMQTSKRKHRI